MKIAHAKAQVVGVARDPTGLLLPLVHGDVADAEPTQSDGGRQSRWTAADDDDVTIAQSHGATPQPVRLHSSAWQ